jgi:hypothetical protein
VSVVWSIGILLPLGQPAVSPETIIQPVEFRPRLQAAGTQRLAIGGCLAMPKYEGGCHCGAIHFEVTAEIRDLVVCNCSICARAGYIHWEVDPEQFSLRTSQQEIENYRFGTMTSQNYFCRTCGMSPFRRSRSAPEKININLRCVDGVDVEAFPVQHFDGRNWEEAMG